MSAAECQYYKNCRFLLKYNDESPALIHQLSLKYCKADFQICARCEYIKKTGNQPPDELMPTGMDAETSEKIIF